MIRFLSAFLLLLGRLEAQTLLAGTGDWPILPTAEPPGPPLVLPPSISPDGQSAVFRWERPAVPEGASIRYEVLLTEGMDTLMYLSTPDLSTTYPPSGKPLEGGHRYCLTVSAQVEERALGYSVPGSPYTFTHLPNCYPPTNLSLQISRQGLLTVTWAPDPGNANGARPILRYRPVGTSNWTYTYMEISPHYINADSCITYEGEIRSGCECMLGTPASNPVCLYFSDWVSIPLTYQEECTYAVPPATIPPHNCGDPVSYTACKGALLTDPNQQFTTIAIRDFPITVTTNTFQNGVWSGTGTVPLPFGNATLKVGWNNLKIAKNFRVCEGTVQGIADDPQYFPNLQPGPLPFGGEICVKPPSTPGFNAQGIHSATGLPWDQNGFGPTGRYVQQPPYPGYSPGMPLDTSGRFDPNGFDANGIHALTGTKFNPEGCGRDGVDSLGQPCDPKKQPYSWLNPPQQPTAEGSAFAEEQKNDLPNKVTAILQSLQTQYQDSLTLQTSECGGIRAQMETLRNGLGFNRTFIYGPGDVYFNAGMHKKFSEAPKILNANVARNPAAESLEKKHIELYECDIRQTAFDEYKQVVAEMLAKVGNLTPALLDAMRALPADSVAHFRANPAAFLAWLRREVVGLVEQERDRRFGFAPAPAEQRDTRLTLSPSERAPSFRMGSAFAGEPLAFGEASGASALLAQSLHARPEDLRFQFHQGALEIGGVHRAYYLKAIAEARHWLGPETAHDPQLMPIDVTNRGTDGRKYSVYMDNIQFSPNEAICDLYILLNLPHNGQTLLFEAHGIGFTPFGPAPGQPMKLQLGQDVHVRLNNNARLKILKGPNTFVNFDCNGFAGMGVEADVELCREVVVPINASTGQVLPEPKRVSGHFQTFMPVLGEFYVQFSMDAFAIPGHEEVQFLIQNVALDMSESVSPQGTPPPGYNTALAGPGGFRPAWKGFYIQALTVKLPNKFSTSSDPIAIGVQNLVIDNMGVSCQAFAANLLPLDRGNAGGWAFSVDSFKLTVVMNQFQDAGFRGRINVPIFKAKTNNSAQVTQADCFSYKAYLRTGNKIEFSVLSPAGQQFKVDMWKAGEVNLSRCAIDLLYENGDFLATASISGDAVINGSLAPGLELDIPKIGFEGVTVSNRAPHFSPGVWRFSDSLGAKLGGFELTFKNIGMAKNSEGDPALAFDAGIAIGDTTTGLSASGAFRVVGELETVGGRQRWKYRKIEVDGICIDGSFQGAASVKGCLAFFKEHPTYGNGFWGNLNVKFEALDSEVGVAGMFGRVSGVKYFFLDALFCGNIPMAGPLQLQGIGGGFSYRMTRPNQAFSLPACGGVTPTMPGQTLSGITYTPDPTKGLGLRFTVAAAIAKKEAFNANATFEMLFSSKGSLEKIWLYGNARFMSAPDRGAPAVRTPGTKPNNGAGVCANVDLSMDFQERHFQGQLEVFVDVANVFTGSGPNGAAGFAQISFRPKKWYIKLGSASAPFGAKTDIPGIGNLVELETYLQLGSEIDPLPPIPDNIASLTGATNLNTVQRGGGGEAGFAFGARVGLGNRDFTFLIFNAGLRADLGFDLGLYDYGANAVCAGSGAPVGINGWYAQGQAYAGIHGHIGIRVKVFGKRKTFNILNLDAAAVLQARLPNPFWAEAAVGGQFSVLNGLVKGNCKFKMTIGEACSVAGQDSVTEDLPLILATKPINRDKLVPVMTDPTVTFNYPVNALVEVPGISNNHYFMRLSYARLRYKGYELPTTHEWSADRRTLTLKMGFALPANDSVTLEVRAYVDSSGHQSEVDERAVTFSTGARSIFVAEANVAGSYPMNGQYNFYPGEIKDGKGYILLRKGQPDLLTESTGSDYELMMRFQTKTGGCTTAPADYNALEKKVTFQIPSGFFVGGKVYRMQLLLAPKKDGNWGPGMAPPDLCSASAAAGGTAPPSEESDGVPQPQLLYTAYFRASVFQSFYDKMKAFEATKQYQGSGATFANTNQTEPFDRFEIAGLGADGPLVSIRADLRASNWVKNSSLKHLFERFPATVFGRTIPLPDKKFDEGVGFAQTGDQNALPTIGAQHYQTPPPTVAAQQRVVFDAGKRLLDAYNDLRQQVGMEIGSRYYSNLIAGQSPLCSDAQTQCNCLESIPVTLVSLGAQGLYCPNGGNAIQWADPTPGNYPVTFSYKLPGTSHKSSVVTINLVRQ